MKVAQRVRAGGHRKRTHTSGYLDDGLPVLQVDARLWDTFSRPGVRLATSYYSDTEALGRDIPLRAGVIDVSSSHHIGRQRTRAAQTELSRLGVSDVGIDRLRGVGRGANASPAPDQLCGRCDPRP